MKIRRLPETDLARIAPLSPHQQRSQLRQHKFGRPPFSYEPLRQSIYDVINVAPDLFGATEPTSWEVVERLIRLRSKSEEEYKSNRSVAFSLHAYSISEGIRARRLEIPPLPLSLDIRVRYWWPFVMLIRGLPVIPFFDPRRTRRLTATGRRFVFSMMHQAIRVPDPDLSEVRLGIFQFDSAENGERTLKLYVEGGEPLYDFAELDEMIRNTYAIWAEVLIERVQEAHRRGSGAQGPLI